MMKLTKQKKAMTVGHSHIKEAFQSRGLFLKISLTFLLLLLSLGLVYFFFSTQMAEKHFQEKNQRLNAGIAESISKELKPFLDGQLNEKATDDIMHYMMAINPSIEVYLLDPDGRILNYVAPYKRVKLSSVSLAPIRKFICTKGSEYIIGDDPRNIGKQKVFSATKVVEGEKILGYVYVILASEEYDSVTARLWGSYILKLGSRYVAITLMATLIVGIIAFWFITKNLSRVIQTVKKFRNGEMSARIPSKPGDEIDTLAVVFNEMADTIVGNIENLKSMENLRRELVGNVSHDLRTPLAVIHGYVETLMIKNDSLNEKERKKYLKIVLESTERLRKLVHELFELSKLETHQISPVKEPFSINELILDITQKYQLIAEKKGITISAERGDENLLVYADVGLIERVLQNLIDNAIKFTQKKGIISIEINQKKQYDTIEIKVSDTGKGIPEDQMPFVFDRYHIGDKRISLDKNSTGLGLAIVKKILEIHDSKIRLNSKVNQGTTFSFQLPQYQ